MRFYDCGSPTPDRKDSVRDYRTMNETEVRGTCKTWTSSVYGTSSKFVRDLFGPHSTLLPRMIIL